MEQTPTEPPETEERIPLRDWPLLIWTAAPLVVITCGLVAMGAYLPLQTRLLMVEKLGVGRGLFWQSVGWAPIIFLWWRLVVREQLFMAGAFPSAPVAMIAAAVAAFFFGWLVFVAGTLCGTLGF